jgi:predicted deacetylase
MTNKEKLIEMINNLNENGIELILKCFNGINENEKYNINTNVERLAKAEELCYIQGFNDAVRMIMNAK